MPGDNEADKEGGRFIGDELMLAIADRMDREKAKLLEKLAPDLETIKSLVKREHFEAAALVYDKIADEFEAAHQPGYEALRWRELAKACRQKVAKKKHKGGKRP
jgi:hypothetical protein